MGPFELCPIDPTVCENNVRGVARVDEDPAGGVGTCLDVEADMDADMGRGDAIRISASLLGSGGANERNRGLCEGGGSWPSDTDELDDEVEEEPDDDKSSSTSSIVLSKRSNEIDAGDNNRLSGLPRGDNGGVVAFPVGNE